SFGDRDGAGADARLRPADGIALDQERGLVVFTDSANHKLRALSLSDGSVSTLAGGETTRDLQMPRRAIVTADAYIVADTRNHQPSPRARRAALSSHGHTRSPDH